MPDDLLKTVRDMKARWMMGGSGLSQAPASWASVAANDPSPDAALIAMAGQAMQYTMHPTPGGPLQKSPLLPRLSLPTPPPPARAQFCSLVRVNKLPESQTHLVLELLATRGYAVHPVDYMPKSFSALPDLYAPWATWNSRESTNGQTHDHEAIDAENWDQWMPAERRVALTSLIASDRDAARVLVADQCPSLPAAERLRILELLSDGLDASDESTLEAFAKDRSGKVRELIQQYLARIGAIEDDTEEVSEYAAFFTVAKRRLKGGYKVTANRLKTKAQRKRRSDLSTRLNLAGFVRGLQLPSESELIDGWENVDEDASDEFVRMVAATGSESAAARLARRIESLDGISAEGFGKLFARLGKESRRDLLPHVLKNDDASFSASVLCAQGPDGVTGVWGELTFPQLQRLPALEELKKIAQAEAEQTHQRTPGQETLRHGLFALGLLVDQATATALLKTLTRNLLFASDPMLGLLRLNACLPLGETS